MTLILEDLTTEELDIVHAMERRGIRFGSLVKGLIAGLREATPLEENAPDARIPPDTATVLPAEFSARLHAIPQSMAPWPSVSVEDTSREIIYSNHD